MTRHYSDLAQLFAGRSAITGFDPASAGAAWDVSDDGTAIRHASEVPATAMGLSAYAGGDRQVSFQILDAPVGAYAQLGLCALAHSGQARLGWIRSLGVGPDGLVRTDGYRACASLGRLVLGDIVTVRVREHLAYVRLGRAGHWNGLARADPLRRTGGVPIEFDEDLFPAVYSDAPGLEVAADFSGWDGPQAGFSHHPRRTSLAWEVSPDGLTAEHRCAEATPAAVLGTPAPEDGDRQVVFLLDELSADGRLQLGVCNAAHLPDNELGGCDSLGLEMDGVVRQAGRSLRHLGALRGDDTVTLRIRGRRAYFRRGPLSLWNGDPTADPERDVGGIPLGFRGPMHPAVYAERPGTKVRGDFTGWPRLVTPNRRRTGREDWA